MSVLALSSVVTVVAVAVVAAFVVIIGLFKAMWRVAEPNEALIISGLRDKGTVTDSAGDEMGFRIVTGKGTLVMPGVQAVRRLSLDLHQSDLDVECVTHQGIPVHVKGTVIYKIGDDRSSITNAARRFLDQQDRMDQRVHNVFAGHLRSIVGSMTVEDMIRDREQLTGKTRAASGEEMAKLGLVVDSLQIQEIDDPTGYIANLARPHTAAVESAARIAQADADREATQREQEANALKAEASRDSAIKQAGYKAERDQAEAQAAQSGPLAEASARQAVVEQETRAAQLEADREQQRLVATVIRPAEAKRDADIAAAEATSRVAELTAEGAAKRVSLGAEAEANAIRLTGRAQADATKAKGEAEGAAIEATGLAQAKAIEARAKALATNPEAVAMQALAERWPEVVREAAGAFAHIDNFTVLNGAEGVNDALMKVAATGMAGFELVRGMFVPKPATTSSSPSRSGGAAALDVTPVETEKRAETLAELDAFEINDAGEHAE